MEGKRPSSPSAESDQATQGLSHLGIARRYADRPYCWHGNDMVGSDRVGTFTRMKQRRIHEAWGWQYYLFLMWSVFSNLKIESQILVLAHLCISLKSPGREKNQSNKREKVQSSFVCFYHRMTWNTKLSQTTTRHLRGGLWVVFNGATIAAGHPEVAC